MDHAVFETVPARSCWGILFVALVAFPHSVSAADDKAPDDTSQADGQAGETSVEIPLYSAIVGEDDWQQASRQPMSPGEIDELIEGDLLRRGIETPPLTTDEQFLRRVSLDLTGQLPTPEEIAAFLSDDNPEKRAKLIDRLLDSDRFARHWARYWRDVVTAPLTLRRSMGLTRSFEEWLFEQIKAGSNWGEITQDILTADGELRFTLNEPTVENGQLFFLVAHDGPEAEERAAETSRVFLGIQIQCAQCHDHPTEAWTRKQFHELSAYFARIKYEQLFIEKKLSGVHIVKLEDKEHHMELLGMPGKKEEVHPSFLDGHSPGNNLDDLARRRALAESIVSKENYWFAASYVNRVWDELMGWSFYQHVDDLGANKGVVYPAVLTRLAGSFRGTDYDLKDVFRAILNSRTYQRQLSRHVPGAGYASIAGVAPTRLRADALWDSLAYVLGKIEHGYRFHTKGGVRFNGSFLRGRFQAEFDFDPSVDKETVEGTLPQTLMLMNNLKLNARIAATHGTLLNETLKQTDGDQEVLEIIYQKVLARKPSAREQTRCLSYIESIESRTEAFEDILWALVNSTEFQTRR